MQQIIPLTSAPNQTFSVSLNVNGGTLLLQLFVRFNEMAGFWVMDILSSTGVRILSSIALTTGAYPGSNLLGPWEYMQIGSAYMINVSGVTTPYAGPNNLGTDFQLLWDDNGALPL